MTTASCKKSERKHTPIVSEAQRGMMGAELGRRKAGKKGKMEGMTTGELESHLHESKGKNLPKRSMRPKGSGLPSDNDYAQGFIRLSKGDGKGGWIESIPIIGPAVKGLRKQKKRLEEGSENTG